MIVLVLLAAQLAFADHYERGMELARASSWAEAHNEFLAGSIESPRDKRFLLELAGVEYKLGDRNGARHFLRAALQLDPNDAYANDFLATLYFLDGNVDAALQYWNRFGKPRIENIAISPQPKIRPELLDRALAFAPGEILTLSRYRSTMAWLTELDIFEGLHLDLRARPDGSFDATFRWNQLPGWIRIASVLAGVPFEILDVKENLGEDDVTVGALYRFDAQKRRVGLSFASPLNRSPKAGYALFADARSETWNLGQPADFRVRKIAAGAGLRFVPFDRFSWETHATVADRSFPGAPQFAGGLSVSHSASFRYRFLDVPDYRLTADLHGSWETGRMFGRTSGGLFSRTQWSVRGQWFPKPRGTDYEVLARISAGAVMGKAPFDQLFMLTYDRDYDLPLRGHRSTIDGKRGSAPIGRRYILANLDFYKAIWHPPLVTIDVGPVLDIGRVWDQVTAKEKGKVLVDAGVQFRLGLPGGFQVVLSYARDLRGGSGAFNDFTR
ncbi:MAG: hypothetical protein JWO19_890 [Bryobacterales bacterium]|nr:hypothetical protein [Bryobacterales bacterium]